MTLLITRSTSEFYSLQLTRTNSRQLRKQSRNCPRNRNVSSDSVAERSIDDFRTVRLEERKDMKLAKAGCSFFSRPDHNAEPCWKKTVNPNNRLAYLKASNNSDIGNEKKSGKSSDGTDLSTNRNTKAKKSKERSAMARKYSTRRTSDQIMIDSGTT